MPARIRAFLGLIAPLALCLTLAQTAPGQTIQPDETLPGVKPFGLLDYHAIDSVSLMSGDTGAAIPLGPSYTLGPGTSWRLRAHGSSKLWFFDSYCPGDPSGRHAYVSGFPTLG